MKIDILTLFPDICRAPLGESIMKRAQGNGIVDLRIHNLRDWTTDKHHIVDDAPFGGGQGMVMKPEPIFAAVEDLRNQASRVVLMSPAGHRFEQQMATQLSQEPHVIIVCGHYEGVDHRVIEHLVDLEISIGDYVLTNGAIAAVVLVDAIVRLLPGALGGRRQFQSRITRSPAVHASRRLSRLESSGGLAFRKSCRDCKVAQRTGDKTHARKSAGSAG